MFPAFGMSTLGFHLLLVHQVELRVLRLPIGGLDAGIQVHPQRLEVHRVRQVETVEAVLQPTLLPALPCEPVPKSIM